MFDDQKIAFIGAGMMGGAFIGGLLQKGILKPEQIIAADPDQTRGNTLAQQHGIQHTTHNTEAAQEADILILAIKPQMADHVLPQLRGRVDSAALVLSVMAGVKIRDISGALHNARVVRSIPNTPATIGEGITVWTATHEVPDQGRQQARTILQALGEQIYVEDEYYLDMATGLSGSGPAFVFLFIEAMIDAGVRVGFPRAQAEKLAMQTIRGAVLYADQSGLHPAVLRNQVTSPGGTTAAGLHELERNALRATIADAVWAAYQRSVELGDSED